MVVGRFVQHDAVFRERVGEVFQSETHSLSPLAAAGPTLSGTAAAACLGGTSGSTVSHPAVVEGVAGDVGDELLCSQRHQSN